MTRPYLIIPQLIEQPTWGGRYILELKGWSENSTNGNKIGQSYELTKTTQLSVNIKDSTDLNFSQNSEGIPIQDVLHEGEKMPLLIKINQARGNSFQLHIKPETPSERWLPKPESWYFLENGYISLGLRDGINIGEYKNTCEEINIFMHGLSGKIVSNELDLGEARKQAHIFVSNKNPWQYVNLFETKKNDLIDLSMGALHHSWEENTALCPLGNIVYEVQLDASDDEATIRAFDQGKIKDDGTIRDMNIEDYFENLDTDPAHNNIEHVRRVQNGDELLRTKFYSVDIIHVSNDEKLMTCGHFSHLYVHDGDVSITAGGTTIRVTKGHSCFIPSSVEKYEISSNTANSVILKTFVSD